MQAANCVVCQERVNLLSQKLVTVQWVDGKTGALLSLTFHSDCYVRWYGETARSAQKAQPQPPQSPEAAPKREAPLAPRQQRPPVPPTPPETPERHLTPDELKRLEQLRGRRDTDAAPRVSGATSGGGSGPGDAAGTQTQEPDQQDDHAPDDEKPKDRHDVAPPDV